MASCDSCASASYTLNIANWSELNITCLRCRHAEALEFLAGGHARVDEFPLRPVTHDLEQRVAADDHGRGQVPVAAREVVVDEARSVSMRWNARPSDPSPGLRGRDRPRRLIESGRRRPSPSIRRRSRPAGLTTMGERRVARILARSAFAATNLSQSAAVRCQALPSARCWPDPVRRMTFTGAATQLPS